MPALTTTSYAVLALLALQPWTTYQLARQMERSLGWIWPRAMSRLYEEPKKLVAAGLAPADPVRPGGGAAPCTPSPPPAAEALAAWLAEPGAGPVLECEALVEIAYADQGTRDGLLANLAALIEDTTAKLHFGQMIADTYLEGRGPFQERLPLQRTDVAVLVGVPRDRAPLGPLGPGQVQAWPATCPGSTRPLNSAGSCPRPAAPAQTGDSQPQHTTGDLRPRVIRRPFPRRTRIGREQRRAIPISTTWGGKRMPIGVIFNFPGGTTEQYDEGCRATERRPALTAHDTEPSRSPNGEPARQPRRVACAAHVFAAHVRADPGLVWTALTDPGQNGSDVDGLAAHSTWAPGDPIEFRLAGRVEAIGRVLHARCHERLSYLLQAGPGDPPVYLTWLLRPGRGGGCVVRLEIDEPDTADSPQDAEDVWAAVLAALQLLVNPA